MSGVFFFQAEDGIRDVAVTGVQTCALPISMWIGTSLLALWTVVHLFDWWIPYAKNSPDNQGRFSFYSQHTQIFPVIGDHYPPDAGHAILDFLLFPTLALALRATIANLRTDRPSPNAL